MGNSYRIQRITDFSINVADDLSKDDEEALAAAIDEVVEQTPLKSDYKAWFGQADTEGKPTMEWYGY